jgi:hypothetical protein
MGLKLRSLCALAYVLGSCALTCNKWRTFTATAGIGIPSNSEKQDATCDSDETGCFEATYDALVPNGGTGQGPGTSFCSGTCQVFEGGCTNNADAGECLQGFETSGNDASYDSGTDEALIPCPGNILISGHSDSTYNGEYKKQSTPFNSNNWYASASGKYLFRYNYTKSYTENKGWALDETSPADYPTTPRRCGCGAGQFCNFDGCNNNNCNNNNCEACSKYSAASDCADDGLPAKGAADCTAQCFESLAAAAAMWKADPLNDATDQSWASGGAEAFTSGNSEDVNGNVIVSPIACINDCFGESGDVGTIQMHCISGSRRLSLEDLEQRQLRGDISNGKCHVCKGDNCNTGSLVIANGALGGASVSALTTMLAVLATAAAAHRGL